MATNNLTARSGYDSHSQSNLGLPREAISPALRGRFHLGREAAVEGWLLVLLSLLIAWLLASNLALRRAINAKQREPFKTRVPRERTIAAQRWLWMVDLSLRWFLSVLSVLSPFKQTLNHTRRASLPPEVSKDPQLLERRRTLGSGVESVNSPASPGAPRHVAVVMDGNRRFGRIKYGDPLKGHSDGGKRLGEFLEWCMEAGVEMVTAFAFSTENWKRDAQEVKMLMDLVCSSCGDLMEDAVKKNMRIRVLASDATRLPERVQTAIRKAEDETRHCTGVLFNICLSYGGRQEIANACRQIAVEIASGVTSLDTVDEYAVERHLLTQGLPDPDLLIRTSGEKRVSNFLLFQMAYTELFFVDKLWPDITQEDVLGIFEAYKTRERRFGC